LGAILLLLHSIAIVDEIHVVCALFVSLPTTATAAVDRVKCCVTVVARSEQGRFKILHRIFKYKTKSLKY